MGQFHLIILTGMSGSGKEPCTTNFVNYGVFLYRQYSAGTDS